MYRATIKIKSRDQILDTMQIMNNLNKYIVVIFFLLLAKAEAQDASPKGGSATYFSDQWVATDGLGRDLPSFKEVGPIRKDKIVGVFYYVWQGFHGDEVHDITEILKQPKNERKWGKKGEFHFWGEPEQGFYQAKDPWVLRRDLQMLTNAKVDFIFIDVTNAFIYPEEVHALFKMGAKMRAEGIPTPAISFCTNAKSGQTMNAIYKEYYTDKKYVDQWFMWDNKPLILGHEKDKALLPEVKDFFTIKYSWAWTNTKEEPNQWQWLDHYPQDYGWSKDPSIPEQITVSTAHHPVNPLGKSYHDGKEPPVHPDYTTDYTNEGLQFKEQWSRALEVDPEVVMVTQWNEWIAQRFIWDKGPGSYGGRPIENGDSYFVDVFSREFNRDMAPMKGGYTDNYYYQLISNVRKFKGMAQPQKVNQPSRISIDGDFDDWDGVTPYFKDPLGDVMHRDYFGYDKKTRFVNKTGRNDIIGAKVGLNDDQVFFYAETKDDLTPYTDDLWMLLFIDIDKDITTGWEGYDYLINHAVSSATKTTLKKWNGAAWVKTGEVNYKFQNNKLELGVPKKLLTPKNGPLDFYFKWADNPKDLEDITAFFMNGDTAPDRRFKYHFKSSEEK